jgi:FkbM family methyltransferase
MNNNGAIETCPVSAIGTHKDFQVIQNIVMQTVLVHSKRGRFYVNPHDTIISKSLTVYGEYAEHEMMLLSHWVQPGQTIIDVGANIGTHSVFFSHQVGSDGNVVALEVQPEIFDVLKQNLKLNNCNNMNVLNLAGGAAIGELELLELDYGRDGNFGAYSFCIDDIGRYLPVNPRARQTLIPVIPLDNLDLEICHLLKVDAEGMELEILTGAAQLVEKHRPILYLENNNRESSSALIEQLSLFEYRNYWHVISYYRKSNFNRFGENIFSAPLELNLLCIPDELNQNPPALPVVTHRDQWFPDEIQQGTYDINDLIALAESFDL